jgi:phosphoserine phosphatase
MREIVLIRITGKDRPGITAALMEVLARYDVTVLDMSQAVIHRSVALGVLVEIPAQHSDSPLFKELLYKAEELGLDVKFSPVNEERYEKWVRGQEAHRWIITILGRSIEAAHIAGLAAIITEHDLNIDAITRLSSRTSLKESAEAGRACIELVALGTPRDVDSMRKDIMNLCAEMEVDIAFQEDTVFRRNRRLIVFDMDSTLIPVEVIDELARKAGVVEEVSAITEAAMRGELDFEMSLRKRVSYLKGLDESVLEEVASEIEFTEGAERLIAHLKELGYTIAILSGGFTYFGKRLQQRLGIDYVFANELEIKDGSLTGGLIGDIVDAEKKAELLAHIAEKENISLKQAVAVGDGANDLKMLGIAGLGIAFHAKPVVKAGSDQAISTLGLDGILYLLGMRDRDAVGS